MKTTTGPHQTTAAECGCGLWICPTCRPSPPPGRDIYSGVGKQRRPYVDEPRPRKRPHATPFVVNIRTWTEMATEKPKVEVA